MIRRFRLWRSRWGLGPPVGVWQMSPPVSRMVGGYRMLCAWRLLPTGDYGYRPLVDAEVERFMANEAW